MSMVILRMKEQPRTMHRTRLRGGRMAVTGRNIREFNQASRVYVWPEGESIMENLLNRRNRPYKEYRKLLADQAFMQNARWSQHAGCRMCPCSPGFILGTTFHNSDGKPVDFHVYVCEEEDLAALQKAAEPATYLDLVAA